MKHIIIDCYTCHYYYYYYCHKSKKIEQIHIWQLNQCNSGKAMDKNEPNPELNATPTTMTITNQVPGYYKCGHCALHFKTRARFRAHEATCLSLKQIRTRATFASASAQEAVSAADLFALVQQLAARLETAEHEIIRLKKQQQQQQRQQQRQQQHGNPIHRDNLLEWLNGTALRPALLEALKPFAEWLPAIPPITREHLVLVFKNGFMDGMCAIIASIVSPSCPLCAYDEHPGALFVYEKKEQYECLGAPEKAFTTCAWRPITHSEFERFINRMQKLLMNEFVRWQQEHTATQLHEADFAEKYDANLLKVMGSGKAKSGGCSNRDMLITRMKPKVYTAIKRAANATTTNDDTYHPTS
jgi:hypothetical protein